MPVTLTIRFDPFLTVATFIPAAAVPVTFISNNLGGRVKTGHPWTLENRPTERNQDKAVIPWRARSGQPHPRGGKWTVPKTCSLPRFSEVEARKPDSSKIRRTHVWHNVILV